MDKPPPVYTIRDSVATRPEELPALTGFRAVAAYMVYLHHFNPNRSIRIFHEAHTGVLFFFVLSGFLITHRHFADFKHAGEPGSRAPWRDYFARRIARIWPLYLVLTIVALLVRRASSLEWFFNLTMLKGLSNPWKFTGIPQGWSLTVEESFYLVAPLIFAVLGALSSRGKTFLLRTLVALLTLSASLWLIGGIGGVLCHEFRLRLFETPQFICLFTFFGRNFEFMCGVFAALLLRDRKVRWTNTYGALAFIVGLIYLMSRFQAGDDPGMFSNAGILINNILLPPFVAWLILSLASEKTFLQQILDSRLARILGASSYAFYLIHLGPVRYAFTFWLPIHSGLGLFLWFNVVAIALKALVEDPLQRKLLRYLRSPRRTPSLARLTGSVAVTHPT